MSDIKEHLRILKTCAPGSTDWITNMLAIGQYHAQELAEAFELHLRYKSVLLKDGIKAAEAIFVHSETAAIDIEAIAWAYRKLQTFGVHTGTVDSAMMMDRLNLILQGQK